MLTLALALVACAAAQVFDVPYAIQPQENLPPLPTLSKRRQFEEPCSEVSELWAAQKAQNSKPGAVQAPIRVRAELAFQCLMTVPVDVEGDIKEIQELKSYLEYQSTLAWLRTGVEGQIAPLDLMGRLDGITTALKNGTFDSDYEVQFVIRRTLDEAGDFHLQYIPDLTAIFQFSRPGGALVSISEDGVLLPKLYMFSDVLANVTGKTTGSEVVKINGQNATDFLKEFSNGTKYHDADARYNTVFPNPPLSALGTDLGGLSYAHYLYTGPTTNYTFANGTSKAIENVAFISAIYDFTSVSDGPTFFKKFCTGPPDPAKPAVVAATTSTRPSSTPTPLPRPSPSLVGYPKPVFIQDSRKVSGYHLSDNSYKDVAVLVLPAFDPTSVNPNATSDPTTPGLIETQRLLRTFFADSLKQGKKKLVIDLRGNGGGTIDVGFELFKQLFPTIEPYGAARYRAHDAFHFYSALVADVAVEGVDKDGKQSVEWDDADYGIQSTFLWSNILDENRQPYKSYKDYYGPETIHNDTFTSIRRYNFSNNLGGHTTSVSLTGYNELAPAPAQPFLPENIVIIQDGFCGSTCAIFAELMREQGKVQTIAIGGLPQNAPMQGVGGSKGSQRLLFDALYSFAERTIKVAEALDGKAVADYLNQSTAVGRIYNAEQIYKRTSPPPPGSSLSGAVNSLNNLRQNDTSETPLEFIYEAADCRLFYTVQSFLDPENLWKQAIDAKWGNGKCVQGSTGHKTAVGVLEKKPFEAKGKGSSQQSNSGTQQTANAAATIGVSSVGIVLVALIAAALVL